MVLSPMVSIDEQLNSLVVELNRTLLQYVFESWPYGPEEAADRVRQVAEAQQRDVAVLCDVLLERQWPIDFGTYPTEYTALQYTSLESLLPRLITSQSLAVQRVEEVSQACADDAFVSEVLKQVLQSERGILGDLKAIFSAP